MQAPPPVAQTAEELTLISFARSTLNLLTFWPALRIAVSQGWGGEAGRTHLAEDLVDLFYTTAMEASSTTSTAVILPELDDIEEVILHVISHDFSLTLEDGSERLVARDLHKLWKECLARSASGGLPPAEGDDGLKEKFEAAAEKARSEDGVRRYEAKREGVSDDEDSEDGTDMDEDDDEDMEDGEGQSKQKDEAVIDEDGFQMVGKKGR